MKRQVGRLLMVLFLAVAAAILLTLGLLCKYNPAGHYQVKNVLLDPQTAKSLSFQQINPKTGEMAQFAYERTEFVAYNNERAEWVREKVSPEVYAAFYKLIEGEQSLMPLSEDIVYRFQLEIPATVTVVVHAKGNIADEADDQVFQEVQLAYEGDYYRIMLHSDSDSDQWAYFHHPKIYQKALEIFVPQP